MNSIGLYIHVPFCEKKCPYCDFYSQKVTGETIDKYTDIVCQTLEKDTNQTNLRFDTVYFGGGTPSLLGNENISKIMNAVKNINKSLLKEATLEINPTTLPILDFEKLKSVGINRLSIGVQSMIDKELKLLGRTHSAEDAKKTIKLAQKAGFTNISLDLMLAIPEQTKESLKRSIDFCISQEIQHISAYLLKIEKGTLFYKNKEKLRLKSEDEETEMYLFLVSELEKNGFKQYEISNFAKDGYKSIHNLKYWNAREYLGIGPSAHSFINGSRFFYQRSISKFLANNLQKVDDGIGGTVDEYAMLRLRLCEGLNNNEFRIKFGFDIPEKYVAQATKLQKHGLTLVDNKNIRLTAKGFLVSNELISKIVI